MAYNSGIKDCADMGKATGLAQRAQTAPAGSFNGGKPPSGPKKEPTLVNGVPMVKDGGMSK